ncbi:Pvc16 family protein [Streptomyces wuyuanensis]|uniref:Pvc16 family protein n=1 Tax=Streptomyces wuyuanensis TaxID=1196353 RepID=UPI00341AFE30
MIKYVDDALEGAIKEASPASFTPHGSINLSFKPPTPETVKAGDRAQLVDVYLYDIQESAERRESGSVVMRSTTKQKNSASGRMEHPPVARHAPPRYLKLSYMITVWMAEPKDSHQMLGLLFAHLAKTPVLKLSDYPWPDETGVSQQQAICAELDVGRPPVQGQILTELWTTFNNTLVPFLNTTVTLPVPAFEPKQTARIVEDVVSPVGLLTPDVQDPGESAAAGEK